MLAETSSLPSFASLFRALAPGVLRSLRRLGVPERDLDDVAQEVFVTLHRKLPELREPAAARAYAYAIALRHAADHRKRAHVRREEPRGDELPERAGSAPQLGAILAEERRRSLERALAELDDDKRAVLVLHELEELPLREVADAVGVPLQTAYSRLVAAKKKLATLLAPAELAPEDRAPSADDDVRAAHLAVTLGIPWRSLPEPIAFEPAPPPSAPSSLGTSGVAAKLVALAAGAGIATLVVLAVVPNTSHPRASQPSTTPAASPTLAETTAPASSSVPSLDPPSIDSPSLDSPSLDPPAESATDPASDPPSAPRARPTERRVPATEPPSRSSSDEPVTADEPEAASASSDRGPSELESLQAARAALASEPGLALLRAEALARDYPHGAFAEEGELVAIEALVRLGRTAIAASRAERFRSAHPRSPYLRRLERLVP